jgi:hypothetical protein
MTSFSLSGVSIRSLGLCVALVVLRFSALAHAQVGGSLSGTIKDSTGGVIPGATVSIANSAIGTALNSVTDTQGHYSFPDIPVGRYDLTVTLEGFKPQAKLSAGQRRPVLRQQQSGPLLRQLHGVD